MYLRPQLRRSRLAPAIAAAACLALLLHVARSAERALYIYRPEARRIEVRDPAWLPRVRIPLSSPPRTVSNPQPETEQWLLPLDEAIRIALANSRVVRILAGTTAVASGSTIYDPAIANTAIDEQQAVFDPVFNVDNTFSQLEPAVVFSPGDGTDRYDLDLSLSKRFISGGQLTFELPSTTLRPGIFAPGPAAAPLSRQTSTSPAISLVQPLLQGGGAAVNLAPVVIARIEAERSFFQLKGSVQDLVQSVIQGYWALVFARTDVWARRQQVEQSQFAVDRAEARRQAGFADIAEVAQTRVALTNFRANLIAAEANLLDTEAALRNLLGLPPNDLRVIVPTTPPSIQRLAFDWEALVALAEQRRPDVIELKLVLEADQQQLLVTRNQALPSLDAVALYRWNGLEGRLPDGTFVSTPGGQFTDWTLGVNFSVPLGLRAGRAAFRRQELVIDRDRVNIQQSLHAAIHNLAADIRLHDSRFEQYGAFRATREAAQTNLEQQFAEYSSGRIIFLNVLNAIADWGTAVSAEARSLTDYNTVLALLERDTGTILETHGVRFYEERYASIGPLGIGCLTAAYPRAEVPTPNRDQYPDSGRPAEEFFDLRSPVTRQSDSELPPPGEQVPAREVPRNAMLPGPTVRLWSR